MSFAFLLSHEGGRNLCRTLGRRARRLPASLVSGADRLPSPAISAFAKAVMKYDGETATDTAVSDDPRM
ncbi:hypothetical protein D3227_08895 [Mesorhizobium waimense]|uniref:Uncharacterized protein n=1 Tax=Mesorhizobium waimense TaxID=1300307 RepID=A0A3A5L041_9HYPH|nr:hypothetical protein D3227_08895 [Mesorhizobium waimense]